MPGAIPAQGGVPARGCTCLDGVPAQGVYLPGGCTCPGGVPAMWVYLPGGIGLPRYYPPPVNRMTDRCKNITLPQTSFAGCNKSATGRQPIGFLGVIELWVRQT